MNRNLTNFIAGDWLRFDYFNYPAFHFVVPDVHKTPEEPTPGMNCLRCINWSNEAFDSHAWIDAYYWIRKAAIYHSQSKDSHRKDGFSDSKILLQSARLYMEFGWLEQAEASLKKASLGILPQIPSPNLSWLTLEWHRLFLYSQGSRPIPGWMSDTDPSNEFDRPGQYPEWHLVIACLFLTAGQFEDAFSAAWEVAFGEGFESPPLRFIAGWYLGLCLVGLEDYDTLRALGEKISPDPGSSPLHQLFLQATRRLYLELKRKNKKNKQVLIWEYADQIDPLLGSASLYYGHKFHRFGYNFLVENRQAKPQDMDWIGYV